MADEYHGIPDDLEESPEDAVKRLAKVAYRALSRLDPADPVHDELKDAIDGVDFLFQSDDPQHNGWVGSDGRP